MALQEVTAGRRKHHQFGQTRTQLVVLWVVILLACDTLNPVKTLLHVFPVVAPWHVASVSFSLLFYIFVAEMKDILYFGTKIFFHVVLSVFFRSVEAVGLHNIPSRDGHSPCIFVVNHANQFIDGLVLMTTCPSKVSFLVAEKSWRRRVIGDFAWAMGGVPIARPQDSVRPGVGRLTLARDGTVAGTGTAFCAHLGPKDKLRLRGNPALFRVAAVDTDTRLRLDAPPDPDAPLPPAEAEFDVLKYVKQTTVYGRVIDMLAGGGAIAIFPEGGSHDRTDLLPLKVGVALIGYSALEKHDVSVPIVPVGLNYFRAHRFRGRVVVEYGTPIYIEPDTLPQFKAGGQDKINVCNGLLERIEDNMKSVIVTTPDYRTLRLIYAARRLFVRRDISSQQKQDMNRRFASGYHLLIQRENPPPQLAELQQQLAVYQDELSDLGIKDYQVPTLGHISDVNYDPDELLEKMRVPWKMAHLFLAMALASLPFLVFNMPVGLAARYYGRIRQRKALAESSVKVKGNDVRLSEMVKLTIVLVPATWIAYTLVLLLCTTLDGPAISLAVFAMPVCSYIGIISTEAGMVDLKDLRPYFMRLHPSARRRLNALPQTRRKLERDLRDFIKIHGPSLGHIYQDKEVDWKSVAKTKRLSMVLPKKSQ